MSQITARLPDAVLAALDAVASELQRSRAEIVRFAIERYLEDFDDLSLTAILHERAEGARKKGFFGATWA